MTLERSDLEPVNPNCEWCHPDSPRAFFSGPRDPQLFLHLNICHREGQQQTVRNAAWCRFLIVKTIVAIVLVCSSVAAFAQAKDTLPGPADPPATASAGKQRFKLVKGATLPDFAYTDFNGATHRFSDLHAKYRLIDFWATWCLPCVADLESKKAAYEKFHRRGFEILSIDDEERRPGAAEKMIAKQSLPWPQARFDPSLIYGKFGVYQLPTFVLVNSENVIVAVTTPPTGPLAGKELSRLLSRLIPPSRRDDATR
jgi:thiol-disulfide isomerase/thioredoxin